MDKVFYALGIVFFLREFELHDQWYVWAIVATAIMIVGLIKMFKLFMEKALSKATVQKPSIDINKAKEDFLKYGTK